MTDISWQVTEMFSSIDGEGIRAGMPAAFIRLAGCNLRCRWCDTPYALEQTSGTPHTLTSILSALDAFGCRNVTLTGGEPLAAPNALKLVQALCRNGYEVNIETNGSLPVSPYTALDHTIVTMDYKPPSSGSNSAMLPENLPALRPGDVLKIVLTEEDFEDVRALLTKCAPQCHIFLSPVFGLTDPAALVRFLLQMVSEGIAPPRLRMQLQLHKYIWPPDMRGV